MRKKEPVSRPTITKDACKDVRTSPDPGLLASVIVDNLQHVKGWTHGHATTNDWYFAIARTVGDRLLDHWMRTLTTYPRQPRIVSYLSSTFLLGPHLGNAMVNLGIYEQVKEAATSLGLDFDKLLDHEQEPGLGNGGLGRLSAYAARHGSYVDLAGPAPNVCKTYPAIPVIVPVKTRFFPMLDSFVDRHAFSPFCFLRLVWLLSALSR